MMSNCDAKLDAQLFVDARAVIGESPMWDSRRNAVYWIDVKGPSLFRTDAESGATRSWNLPDEIGGYALRPDGVGAILGLRSGIFDLSFSTGNLKKLCAAPFDPGTHRFNEGACDKSGRLWLGTMFDPREGHRCKPQKEHLYSYTSDGGLVKHHDCGLLYNGFAWARDETEFFFAHSREGCIYACAFDCEHGLLGPKRVFAKVPNDLGLPDGGAFDEDGFYWSAIHGGGRLHRYAPNGRLGRVIELPVQNPTMVAFCGPDLSNLIITSATHGKRGKPHEGGLFRLSPGVHGLPRPNTAR